MFQHRAVLNVWQGRDAPLGGGIKAIERWGGSEVGFKSGCDSGLRRMNKGSEGSFVPVRRQFRSG